MSQLALFTDPAVTGLCPDCGRPLHWLYSPARPGAPWDEVPGADWTYGANWGTCPCSPRVVRAVKPLEPWPGRAA